MSLSFRYAREGSVLSRAENPFIFREQGSSAKKIDSYWTVEVGFEMNRPTFNWPNRSCVSLV